MPRIRTIKPDFFTNEDIGKLTAEARLLFIGLWTLADREGRLQDRPIRIKAQLFPYDNWPVASLLENLEEAELIWRYEAEGRKCIQIINFVKHQKPHPREIDSNLPPHPTQSREKVVPSREKDRPGPERGLASRVDSHVLTIDYGLMESSHSRSRPKTPSAERESRFSLKDCRKYAESLPSIRSPAAFAKSIWRTGEDDEAIARFLDSGGCKETDKEHSARLARIAASVERSS